MKAVILTEGGQKTGCGHITRCLALKAALLVERVPVTLIVNGDTSVKKYFHKQVTQVFDWLGAPEKLSEQLNSADIVIIDSYLAPLGFYKKVSERIPVPVYLDDYARLSYPRGIVINTALGSEKIAYPQKEDVRYLLGISFALLREEFWRVSKKNIRREVRDILITLGGMERTDFIAAMMKCLSPESQRLKFHIVTVQPYRGHGRSIDQMNCRFYSGLTASKIKDLMLRCDVAISGGGQTTNELAACGLPAIGICFSENQRFNLNAWEKQGFIMCAGSFQSSGVLKKTASFLRDLSFKQRSAMSLRGQGLVDGKGAQRIAKAIIDACFMFCPMTAADCRQAFRWSNDTEVRAVSFSSAPIRWEDHCKWFSEKLKDPQTLFYKIIWREHSIGQVRFDRRGTRARISISLSPKYRGKGLGGTVIRLASRKVFHDHGIYAIDAFIKTSNHLSARSFMRAGFRSLDITKINGQNCYHFMLKNDVRNEKK